MSDDKKRGFANWDPEKHREVARRGGRSTAESGLGHRFTPEEAREAGRKGGRPPKARSQATPPKVES